jgi:hypothetical protein
MRCHCVRVCVCLRVCVHVSGFDCVRMSVCVRVLVCVSVGKKQGLGFNVTLFHIIPVCVCVCQRTVNLWQVHANGCISALAATM